MPWLHKSSRICLPEITIKCALILVYILLFTNNLKFVNASAWFVNLVAIKRMRKENARMPGGIEKQQLIHLKLS